ncbi:uncharacterized protein LOC113034775 [Astatotilapia calliptera]|uniref:uncharacterized protein LOC113034775 n=1 Tax=Astatotilapia calliptera TaxID=8154 RepID=UPI000E423727|nr:uncharacterized protein LOC113034775 [Astatotilapia calliptera]
MGRSVVLGAVLVLLVANVSFCQAETVEEYFRVGGTLQLSPQPVGGAITSIVWKYGKNLLAEWETKQIPLTYYSKFRGRTTLNTGTGELEIRNMTAADNEVYTVEINNHVQSRVHKIMAIEDVPQPVLEAKPLSCSSASKDCKLVCEGNVSKAGPVEYFWKKDDGEWEKSKENTMEIINDAETQRVKKFSCRIKNQFSEKESNAFNVFYREETTKEPSSPGSGVILGIVLPVLILLVVPAVPILLYFIWEPFKNKVDSCLPWKERADAAGTTTVYTAVAATNGGAEQPKKEENNEPKSEPEIDP